MVTGIRHLQRACLAFGFAWLAMIDGAHAQGDRSARPGDFDYYVLTLNWSPTYCASREDGANDRGRARNGDDGYRFSDDRRNRRDSGAEQQCNGTRPYAFILHGLWPQYERRGWPESCRTDYRPWVPNELIDRMLDIMPSRQLVIHEYKKHGTCSGMDPRGYFAAARKAYNSIRIPDEFQDLTKPLRVGPDEVRRAFLDVNRNLTPDMVQIVCSRNRLQEVRICMTKDLQPRLCSEGDRSRRLCNYDTVTMPPIRGGGFGPQGGPTQRGDRL
ncbi:ribonuclease T2 [Rhodomicrobium sp. Az07]|nr:ribonuclease T2 [Rhodomicrobium sp. Az07]